MTHVRPRNHKERSQQTFPRRTDGPTLPRRWSILVPQEDYHGRLALSATIRRFPGSKLHSSLVTSLSVTSDHDGYSQDPSVTQDLQTDISFGPEVTFFSKPNTFLDASIIQMIVCQWFISRRIGNLGENATDILDPNI